MHFADAGSGRDQLVERAEAESPGVADEDGVRGGRRHRHVFAPPERVAVDNAGKLWVEPVEDVGGVLRRIGEGGDAEHAPSLLGDQALDFDAALEWAGKLETIGGGGDDRIHDDRTGNRDHAVGGDVHINDARNIRRGHYDIGKREAGAIRNLERGGIGAADDGRLSRRGVCRDD